MWQWGLCITRCHNILRNSSYSYDNIHLQSCDTLYDTELVGVIA
jgi:hypothetical protein